MPTSEEVFFVPEMSGDPRIRVFRRVFKAPGEFEKMEVDAYVLTTATYLVVFDTLLCPEDVHAMMQVMQDQIAGRQVLVVNSHADWDHAWGNAYFTGEHAAPIIAHEHGRIRMESEQARAELADFQQRYPVFRNVQLIPATLAFNNELTIHDGDLTIELFPAPGHHRDHIAAWIPQLSLLLAFDAVENPLPCIEDAEAVPSMFATLERFLTLPSERVLCSHGKTTGPAMVQANLAYLREIERRCRELLSKRRPTLQELENPAEVIDYRLDDVIAGSTGEVDRPFYGQAHDDNIRYVMQWLMR